MFFGIEIWSLSRLLRAILMPDKPLIHVAKQFQFCFVNLQNCLLALCKHFRISSDISPPTFVLLLGQEWDVLSKPQMPYLLTDAFVSDLTKLSVRHIFLHALTNLHFFLGLVQKIFCCFAVSWDFIYRVSAVVFGVLIYSLPFW